MTLLDQLDPKQLQALADKAGIDKAKVLEVAQKVLPVIKSKWQSLSAGGDAALFGDLLKQKQFSDMFGSPELTAATARAAKESGVDASAIAKLLPELGKLVSK